MNKMTETMLYMVIGFVFAEIWAAYWRRHDGRDIARYLVVLLLWPVVILIVIKSLIGGPISK